MAKVQLIAAICVAAASFLSPVGSMTQALAHGGGHHDSGGQSGQTGEEEHSGDSIGGGRVGTFSGDAGDHQNVTDGRSRRSGDFQGQDSFNNRSDDHQDGCYHPERQFDRAEHSLRPDMCAD